MPGLWAPLAGWAVVLIPSLWAAGLGHRHLKFLLYVGVPFSVFNLLTWGVVVAAPPGLAPGSDTAGGLAYGAKMSIRLVLLAGIFQLSVQSVPGTALPALLSRWGVRGNALVVCLGAFAVFPEMSRRAGQLVTARIARGLMPRRNIIWRVVQLPFVVRGLFVLALRTAVARAEGWQQKALLQRVSLMSNGPAVGTAVGSCVWLTLAAAWLACGVAARVTGVSPP